MTISTWSEVSSNSNTTYAPMSSGYAWYDPTGLGLFSSSNLSIDVNCKLVDFSDRYVYLFDGEHLIVYDSETWTELDRVTRRIKAIYPDMAFSEDGGILQYDGSNIVQRGTYSGVPVFTAMTLYNGKLLNYALGVDGKYSVIDKCDGVMPVGNIVASGFDPENGMFLVVSEYRSIIWSYNDDLEFSFYNAYNHDKAVGISNYNVVLNGANTGEPGKITNIFDFS